MGNRQESGVAAELVDYGSGAWAVANLPSANFSCVRRRRADPGKQNSVKKDGLPSADPFSNFGASGRRLLTSLRTVCDSPLSIKNNPGLLRACATLAEVATRLLLPRE